MVWVNEAHAKNHYPLDEAWAKNVFEKTSSAYEKEGKELKFKNHIEFGTNIQKMLIKFLREGPVVAMCLEGIDAPEVVRKITGATEPKAALPGTIRGDFAHMSYGRADATNRAIPNLIHASGNKQEAEKEIALWFKDSELHTYNTVNDLHTI